MTGVIPQFLYWSEKIKVHRGWMCFLLHILLLYHIIAPQTDQKSRCTSCKCLGMDERVPKHWAKIQSAWGAWNSQHIHAGENEKTKQCSNRDLCIMYCFPRKTSTCSYKLEVHRDFCAGSNGFGMYRWWIACVGNHDSQHHHGSGVARAACFGGGIGKGHKPAQETRVRFSALRHFNCVLIIVGRWCKFDTILFTLFLVFFFSHTILRTFLYSVYNTIFFQRDQTSLQSRRLF